jgi:hypothetical protein
MTPGNNPLDPETVRATARSEYEVLRQIARKPGLSVSAAGAEIDAELDRLTRAHVVGMTADQAAQFIQIYNGEYNRLVREKLQKNTGCAAAVLIAATTGLSALLYSALAAVP